MSGVPYWCCGDCTPAGCAIKKICSDDNYYAEYISVGRPRPPKNYNGTYWAAWHNSIGKKSKLDADVLIKLVKRTLVNDGGCGGACGTPTTGLGTSQNCATNGSLGSTPRCKRTVYVDNMEWRFVTQLDLWGVSNDQQMEEEEDGEQLISVPPGRYPCGFSVGCGSAFCTNLNAATSFGQFPQWWAKENVKMLPRFSNLETAVEATPLISYSYPQISNCGQIQRVNRCVGSIVNQVDTVCIDYPMVVLPSHGGLRCDGLTEACDRETPQNGTNNWSIGLDIISKSLMDRLDAIGVPTDVGIGVWNQTWVCKTSGRFRILFDGRPLTPNAGDVYKPSSKTTFTGTAVLDTGTASYSFDIKITMEPQKWCYKDPECPCMQSWCEHGPTSLHFEANVPLDVQNVCSGNNSISLSVDAGLETCYRPFGTIGWNTCYMWDDLPSNTYAGDPAFIRNTFRYLGAEPVERGHPYWVKYRSRYNHTETVNRWYQGTSNDPASLCPASRSGPSTPLGGYSFYVGSNQAYRASQSVCASQCAPGVFCCSCGFPASTTTYAPAGCYPSRVSNTYNSCDYTAPYCDPTCQGCVSTAGTGTVPGSTPCGSSSCGTMSIPTQPNMNCQAFLGCNGLPDFNHSIIFHICASAYFDICNLVSLSGSAGYQASIGAPDTWIFEEWDPKDSCTPLGTWIMKRASFETVCEGPSAWIGGIQLTVS